MQMPFGKHKGKDLREVPDDYLLWVLDKCDAASPTLKSAIRQRLGVGEPSPASAPPPGSGVAIEAVVRAWVRQMTLKYHPDRGGSHEAMIAVNDGAELLRRLAGM